MIVYCVFFDDLILKILYILRFCYLSDNIVTYRKCIEKRVYMHIY